MVASAFSAGAETSTRLAPAVRCADAFSLAVKMPVHSSAISTPRSFQGSFDGSRCAVTLILPLPRLIESPSTVTVPGNRPCTESKRRRWALVSTGPRSLMATTSISLRPDSAMARSTLRPIRPNPLIATRTAILRLSFNDLCHPRRGCEPSTKALRRTPGSAGRERIIWALVSLFSPQSQPLAQSLQRCVYRSLGGNSEVLEKVLGRRAFAETVHTDE